jgi:hypothetical protein
MISEQGYREYLDELFFSKGLPDNNQMIEIRDIAEKFLYSKQSLNTYITKHGLKAIPKSGAINATWIVRVSDLKEFMLSSYLKQKENEASRDAKEIADKPKQIDNGSEL